MNAFGCQNQKFVNPFNAEWKKNDILHTIDFNDVIVLYRKII